MIYSLHKALMFNVHPSVNSLIRAILGIWLILICEVPAHLSPHPDIGHFSRDLTGWEGDREMKDPLIAPKEIKYHRYLESSEIALHAIHSRQIIYAEWENTWYSLGCH